MAEYLRILDPRNPDHRAELEAALYDEDAWKEFAVQDCISYDQLREARRELLDDAGEVGVVIRDDEDLSFIEREGHRPCTVNWSTGLLARTIVHLEVPQEGDLIDFLSS